MKIVEQAKSAIREQRLLIGAFVSGLGGLGAFMAWCAVVISGGKAAALQVPGLVGAGCCLGGVILADLLFIRYCFSGE